MVFELTVQLRLALGATKTGIDGVGPKLAEVGAGQVQGVCRGDEVVA